MAQSRFSRIRRFSARRRKLTLLILFAFLVGAFWFIYQKTSAVSTQMLASDVVRRGTVNKTLSATGIIKPEVGATVKIGSRSTGIIRKMHVRVGDTVTEGQIIAEIDSRELEAVVAESEAALKRAQIEYERILASYPLQIKEAEAKVASAKATAEYAELSYKRQMELTGRNLDSQNNLDLAREKAVTGVQALTVAKATLDRLEEEFIRQRASAEQSRIQAEASLATARIKLSYATIRSPMNGVVSQIAAQEGETAVAGLQVVNLITVVDLSRKEMWVYIDENDVGQLTPGMQVDFRVDALPGRTFSGRIYRIYPEAEIRDSIVYYQTIVPLSKEDSLALRSEMTTQCTVYVESKENALLVPNEAIKWINGSQVVFVRRGNVVLPVQVLFGMRGTESSEVLEGLEEGDVVATRLILGEDVTSGMPVASAALPAGPGGGTGASGGGPRPR
jgi:multidrug efflux pump subunit AcrA (membrane-fusion protein)